jgi:hypothetical protein
MHSFSPKYGNLMKKRVSLRVALFSLRLLWQSESTMLLGDSFGLAPKMLLGDWMSVNKAGERVGPAGGNRQCLFSEAI